MIIFKLTILIFCFFIGNSIVGMFLGAFWKCVADSKTLKHQKTEKTTAENYVGGNYGYARDFLVGTGFLFVLFSVLTLLVIYRGAGFGTLSKLFLFVYLVVLVGTLFLLLVVQRFRFLFVGKVRQLKSRDYWKEQWLWVVLFLVIGVTFFMHRPYLENRFDLPERMSTLEVTGTFAGINPLTGEVAVAPSRVQQWLKGMVPAWYLFFSRLLNVPTYQMLFGVVPLWTLGLCMSAYYLIAQVLFDENKKRIRYFMVFFTLFTLGGNKAYMNPSYGLLHYGYEESTLLSNVVLPCVFALILMMIKRGASKKMVQDCET